ENRIHDAAEVSRIRRRTILSTAGCAESKQNAEGQTDHCEPIHCLSFGSSGSAERQLNWHPGFLSSKRLIPSNVTSVPATYSRRKFGSSASWSSVRSVIAVSVRSSDCSDFS